MAAIDASSRAQGVTDAAIDFARLLDRPVELLHVIETEVPAEELAVELEEASMQAEVVVTDNVDRLRNAGIAGPVTYSGSWAGTAVQGVASPNLPIRCTPR